MHHLVSGIQLNPHSSKSGNLGSLRGSTGLFKENGWVGFSFLIGELKFLKKNLIKRRLFSSTQRVYKGY